MGSYQTRKPRTDWTQIFQFYSSRCRSHCPCQTWRSLLLSGRWIRSPASVIFQRRTADKIFAIACHPAIGRIICAKGVSYQPVLTAGKGTSDMNSSNEDGARGAWVVGVHKTSEFGGKICPPPERSEDFVTRSSFFCFAFLLAKRWPTAPATTERNKFGSSRRSRRCCAISRLRRRRTSTASATLFSRTERATMLRR